MRSHRALPPTEPPSLAGPAGGSPRPAVPRGSIPGLHHIPRAQHGHIWARDQRSPGNGGRAAAPAAPGSSGRRARPQRGAGAAHARVRPAPAAGVALGLPCRGHSGVLPWGSCSFSGSRSLSRTSPVLPATPQLNPCAVPQSWLPARLRAAPRCVLQWVCSALFPIRGGS